MDSKDYNKCKNSIKSAIRKSFARSDKYKSFMERHRVEWCSFDYRNSGEIHSKRKRVSYPCSGCGKLFKGNEVNVDHIDPIGHGVFDKIEDTIEFFNAVYCDESNLQILCKSCHKEKTAKEKKIKSFKNASF